MGLEFNRENSQNIITRTGRNRSSLRGWTHVLIRKIIVAQVVTDQGTKNEHPERAVNVYGRDTNVTTKFGTAERKMLGKPYGPVYDVETRAYDRRRDHPMWLTTCVHAGGPTSSCRTA